MAKEKSETFDIRLSLEAELKPRIRSAAGKLDLPMVDLAREGVLRLVELIESGKIARKDLKFVE